MSREQLLGLAADVDRLLVAGATAASTSDPLLSRGKVLRELSKKVGSLVSVADGVDRLLRSSSEQAGTALLELTVMIRQIRTSLSAVGCAGEMTPLSASGSWRTPLPVRDAQLIYEKLTNRSNRGGELFRHAVEKNRIDDLRLASSLYKVLDDGEVEFADLAAEKALPSFGVAVVPELEASLELKGKRGNARRLLAVCKIDPKKGAEYCRKALASGSDALKMQALESLVAVGEPGEAETAGLKLFADKSKYVRIAAVTALQTAQSDEAVDRLLEALAHEDYEFHYRAESSLQRMPHPKAIDRLLGELHDRLARLDAAEAAWASAKKEKRKKNKTPPTPRGKEKSADDPVTAAENRRDQIREYIERLIQVIGGREDRDRRAAGTALLSLLNHKSDDIVLAAIRSLGSFAGSLPEVVPALTQLLDSKDVYTRITAIETFQDVKPEDRSPAIPKLIELARDKKFADNLESILEVLPAHIQEYPDAILQLLRDLLRAKAKDADEVLEAIAAIGPAGKSLIPEVLAYLCESSYYIYFGYHETVAKIDPEGTEFIPAFLDLLQGKKPERQAVALAGLRSYGPKAVAAIPLLEEIAAHKNSKLKSQADFALQAIRGEI